MGETAYYESLQKHYGPVQMLAWFVVVLVSSSGVFAGINMMYVAVAGRVREIATLQAIGYWRRAILLSLVQEGLMLASAAYVLACTVGRWLVDGVAIDNYGNFIDNGYTWNRVRCNGMFPIERHSV